MLEAKEVAGDIVGARTLMYKVRPRIQRYTSLGADGPLLHHDAAAQIPARGPGAARRVLRAAW